MANAVGYPFKRGINFAGGYRPLSSPAVRLIQTDMLFDLPATVITITAVVITNQGQSLVVNAKRVITVVPGSMTLTGVTVSAFINKRITIAPSTSVYSGQPLNVNYKKNIVVTPVNLLHSGQQIATNSKKIVSTGFATISYTPVSISVKRNTQVTILPSGITYAGKTIAVPSTGGPNAGGYRWNRLDLGILLGL